MNDYRAYVECDYNSIYHHGIKGQKWGVRRYQNEDGTRTEAGKKRYGDMHIHLDPISFVANVVNRKQGQRLTSIKVSGRDDSDRLFIDSILFIPFNAAKRGIRNEKERKRLIEESKFKSVDTNSKRYKSIEKEKQAWMDAWQTYSDDQSDMNYKNYINKRDEYMNKAYEINKKYSRRR